VATNLAGELSRTKPVCLIDCDVPQDTSTSWYSVRRAKKPSQNLTAYRVSNGQDLLDFVDKEAGKYKYVILDSPPRITDIGRAIALVSDLIIVPVGASSAEIWASEDVKVMLGQAGEVKGAPLDAHLLWTRYKDYTVLSREIHDEAEKFMGIPSLETTLGYRQAYIEALGSGLTAGETKDKKAQLEVASLCVEVKKLLKQGE